MNETFYIQNYRDKAPNIVFKKELIDKTASSVIEIISPTFYERVRNGNIDEVENLIDKILNARFNMKASV